MPVEGFAAQLIAALEEAQAAASQPKPPHLLAQAAYEKLQFDFPVVSEAELAALVDEFAGGKRRAVTTRFLAVLRENAGGSSNAGGSGATTADTASSAFSGPSGSSGSSGRGLVPLYQQLYAVAVLQTLQSCLEAPEAAAAAQLAGLAPSAGGSSSFFGAEGNSALEAALAAAAEQQSAEGDRSELEHRLSQHEDDDSFAYEPLEAAPTRAEAGQQPAAQPGGDSTAAALPAQLAELAGHLSYHCMNEAAAWRELRLMQRLAACLAAIRRRHPGLPDLDAVAQPLLRLAVDRCVAAPAELEAGLPALLDALGATADGSGTSSSSNASATKTLPSQQDGAVASAAADAAAAELAVEAAVALAAQVTAPSARRRLWQETYQRLLPLAAQQLERQQVELARQARLAASKPGAKAGTAGVAQPSAQQLYSIMLACQLLYFFVLQAPPGFSAATATGGSGGGSSGSGGTSRLQDAFLRGGLLRSLVLLFIQLGAQPGAEPLRCALLLACAAAQPLTDWASAVPGFAAAVAAPELGPSGAAQLHGALWSVLLGSGGSALGTLLGDATPADKVPAIFQALQLMADVQAVAHRPLWDGEVMAALRRLGDTLRQQYSKPRDEAEAGGDAERSERAAAGMAESGDGEAGEGGAAHADEADAAKLALGAEEQAVVLAARRAQQLQPACLKLVKDLLQRGGGSGKHD